jgi:hypothetical protein
MEDALVIRVDRAEADIGDLRSELRHTRRELGNVQRGVAELAVEVKATNVTLERVAGALDALKNTLIAGSALGTVIAALLAAL